MPTIKRALVAEADDLQAARYRQLLKPLGYEVEVVPDGMAANEAVNRSGSIDLLFVDLSLPLLDGFEVIAHFRQRQSHKGALVAAVSGLPSLRALALKRRAELGIDEILSQAFDDQTLGQILSKSAEAQAVLRARQAAGEQELLRQMKEQEQNKQTLAQMESRLGLLVMAMNQLPLGVLLMDAERKILMANRSLALMTGRSVADMVGKTGAEFARENIGLFDDASEYLAKMKVLPEGPYVADESFFVDRPYPRRMRWMAKPILLPTGKGQMDVFMDLG